MVRATGGVCGLFVALLGDIWRHFRVVFDGHFEHFSGQLREIVLV